jgi:hypothetical protein
VADKDMIREGPRGSSRIPAANIIPAGAKKLPFSTNSYEFYYHKTGKKSALYVKIIDYHPGILEVPLSKLEEMLQYLKGE